MKPKKSKPAITAQDLVESIQASQRERDAIFLANSPSDKVEKGFRRSKEWAAIWRVTKVKACETLAALLKKGAMERKAYRLRTNGKGRLNLIPHYRLT